jgi:hypothetical protein
MQLIQLPYFADKRNATLDCRGDGVVVYAVITVLISAIERRHSDMNAFVKQIYRWKRDKSGTGNDTDTHGRSSQLRAGPRRRNQKSAFGIFQE